MRHFRRANSEKSFASPRLSAWFWGITMLSASPLPCRRNEYACDSIATGIDPTPPGLAGCATRQVRKKCAAPSGLSVLGSPVNPWRRHGLGIFRPVGAPDFGCTFDPWRCHGLGGISPRWGFGSARCCRQLPESASFARFRSDDRGGTGYRVCAIRALSECRRAGRPRSCKPGFGEPVPFRRRPPRELRNLLRGDSRSDAGG